MESLANSKQIEDLEKILTEAVSELSLFNVQPEFSGQNFITIFKNDKVNSVAILHKGKNGLRLLIVELEILLNLEAKYKGKYKEYLKDFS